MTTHERAWIRCVYIVLNFPWQKDKIYTWQKYFYLSWQIQKSSFAIIHKTKNYHGTHERSFVTINKLNLSCQKYSLICHSKQKSCFAIIHTLIDSHDQGESEMKRRNGKESEEGEEKEFAL